GLAWMIFGSGDRSRRAVPHHVSHHGSTHARTGSQGWSDDDDDDDRYDTRSNRLRHDSRPGRARGIAGSGAQPAWVRRFDDPYAQRDQRDTQASGDNRGARHGHDDSDGETRGWADKARDMGAS